MTAEIAALDDALERAGEDVVLRRFAGKAPNQVSVDVTVRAVVRTVSADQVVGTIVQNDLNVVISPSQIIAAQWPGGLRDGAVQSAAAPRIPRATDKIVIQGRERQIRIAKPIFVGGVWVRCDLVVAG